MGWSTLANIKGPVGVQGPIGAQGPPGSPGSTGAQGPVGPIGFATPSGSYRGSWVDTGPSNPTANPNGEAGIAVTGPKVVTDITQPIGAPVGCSLSAGTVTVTQPGIWNFQGTTQYGGGNTAIRAIYFVQGASATATPKYGLFGTASADSMATDATFSLAAGDKVSLCTDLWSGSNLWVWKNFGCTIIATWLGNPQQVATATVPPVVVQLSDASTINTDATAGNLFRVSIAGNRTLAAPTNPVDGQRIVWEVAASGGIRTLSLATGTGGFTFGADITAVSSIASGKTDFIGAIYNASVNKWRVVAYSKGF